MLHSFSALDIQKMRNNLKSSKSYPHDLKEKVSEEDEDEEKEKQQQQKEEVSAKKEEAKTESIPAAPQTTASKVVKQVAASFNNKAESAAPSQPFSGQTAGAAVAAETKKPESQLINVSDERRSLLINSNH